MFTEYDIWSRQKKSLAAAGYDVLPFKEREVWWCSLGLNLGDEIKGKNVPFERPALIIKQFNNRVAWIIPMTSTIKSAKFYFTITVQGATSCLILSQIRFASVKRLRRILGEVSPEEFAQIKAKFIRLVIDP